MAVTLRNPSVNVGTSSMGHMVAQYWSKVALIQLYPSLQNVELAAEGGPNAYKTIPARTGQKINFFRDPVLAASYSTINESADDPTPLSYVMSAVSAQTGMYMQSIVIPDLTQSIALKSAIDRAARGLTFAGMRTFNGLIGGEISANGTGYFCGDATSAADLTATDVLKRAELEKMSMKLHANNVHTYPDGKYKLVTHPVCIQELRADTGTLGLFDLVKYVAGHEDEKRSFHVGTVSDFKIMESTEFSATSSISGTGYGYYSLWCGYEGVGAVALGGEYTPSPLKKDTGLLIKKSRWQPDRSNFMIVVHLPGSGGTADPGNRRASVAYKFFTAVKVLNSKCAGTLLCGSTYSSTGA